MLRYKLKLKQKNVSTFNFGLGQQLHGFIYSVIGGFLEHDAQDTSFSQFLELNNNEVSWYLNVMEKDYIFDALLDNIKDVNLNNYQFEVIDVSQVVSIGISDRYEFKIVTPAFFKSGGRYHSNFSKRTLINSLVNTLPRSEYMIKDVINDLEANLLIGDFSFASELVSIKKIKTQGITGRLELRYEGQEPELFNKMINNLQLRGLGVKAALGFGGLIIKELNEE